MTSEGAYVMCRTCLNYSSPFSNIFKELLGEGYVYEVLMDVCQIEVSSDDGLPEYVCFDCHKNLSKFHSFKMQTQESNATLHRFKNEHEIKIEPASSFTSSTPNYGSSLESTTTTMKECYVRLFRCDQLLQDGHSRKVNIKREKEDPSYLGDNESGSIQGADMQVTHPGIKMDIEESMEEKMIGFYEASLLSPKTENLKVGEVSVRHSIEAIVNNISVPCEYTNYSENINGIHEANINVVNITKRTELFEARLLSNRTPPSLPRENLKFEEVTVGDLEEEGIPTLILDSLANSGTEEGVVEILPLALIAKRGLLNMPEGVSKECQREEICWTNMQRIGKQKKYLCNENMLSNGKLFEGDEVDEQFKGEAQIQEMKRDLNHVSFTCSNDCGFFSEKSAEGKGKHTSEEIHYPSPETDYQSATLESREILKSANNIQTGVKLSVCQVLENGFRSKRGLKMHQRVHMLENQFECEVCGKKFSKKSSCQRHQKTHNTSRNVTICEAGNNLNSSCSSDRIKQGHLEECKKILIDCSHLERKKMVEDDSVCGDSNVQLREGEKSGFCGVFVCDRCRKEFYDKIDLLKHLVVHSRKGNIALLSAEAKNTSDEISSATECRKKRGAKVSKEKKMRKVKWKCHWCEKEFDYASILKSHERLHTGEKPFQCKYCPKKFAFKNVANRHELIHTGMKPYKCKYCCKKFRHKSSIKDHEFLHIGVKPYACKYCKKKFSTNSALKNHERIHTGVKPYSCKYCSKKFTQRGTLNRHVILH